MDEYSVDVFVWAEDAEDAVNIASGAIARPGAHQGVICTEKKRASELAKVQGDFLYKVSVSAERA